MNAANLSNKAQIVDAIYNEFSDRKARRFNGNKDMQYWGPGIFNLFNNDECRPIHGMLYYENTTCGTWAQFFEDMIKIQGIRESQLIIVDWYKILANTPNGYEHTVNFVVDVGAFFNGDNNWFWHGEHIGGDIYPYAEFSVKEWDNNLIEPRKFVVSEADIYHVPLNFEISILLNNGNFIQWIEQTGTAGQGYHDPKSEHTNHAIVKYNKKYYDPSYGSTPMNSKEEWENASLDFFQTYLGYSLVINGMEKDVRISWIAETNVADLQTRFSN